MADTATQKRQGRKGTAKKGGRSGSRNGARLRDWGVADSAAVPKAVASYSEKCLRAYRANPDLVLEHANMERAAVEGGYGRRQLFELIQNGADELVGQHGRVEVVLTPDALYCANEGKPVSDKGVPALLAAHVSPKKGVEIGRFGLGFKSVLGVTTSPQFFSRTGSFVFDPDWARKEIKDVVPDADRTPTLRLARSVDAKKEAKGDAVLADLMGWASTVIRLPLDKKADWLLRNLAGFPRQFLVFSPHVSTLVLDDRQQSEKRVIELEDHGESGKTLIEDKTREVWHVFQRNVKPSKAADADAGALQGREQIPVVWAVPVEGARAGGRGGFWAFFPTEYVTTLSGVVNAPWKLNEDRKSILEGAFNGELVDVAAKIVVDDLEAVAGKEDPGAVLDLLPGRGREAPNWADKRLTEKVYELAANSPVIPDQEGELQLPMSLALHPTGIPDEALAAWSRAPERPTDWCHPSVDRRDRRARVERLLEDKGREPASFETWFGEIIRNPTVESSKAAITVASEIERTGESEHRDALRHCPYVLSASGELLPPDPERIFLPGEHPVISKRIQLVNPGLAKDREVRQRLEALGIRQVDPGLELLSKLATGKLEKWGDGDWDEFWILARRAGPTRAGAAVEKLGLAPEIHVRVRSGAWEAAEAVLLPGPIVRADDEADGEVLVDTDYHADDVAAIKRLGVGQGPVTGGGSIDEGWFAEYRNEELGALLTQIESAGARPGREHFGFDERQLAGPMTGFDRLSEPARARFTVELLKAQDDLRPWSLRHRTVDRYRSRSCPNPIVWAVAKYGRFETPLGIQSADECVGPQLDAWSDLFPVADCPDEAAEALEMPTTLEELSPERWSSALDRALNLEDDQTRGGFYAAAAAHAPAPDFIKCRFGPRLDTEATDAVNVAWDAEDFDALIASELPALIATSREAANLLVERWGLRSAADSVHTELSYAAEDEAVPLVDTFPLLRGELIDELADLRHVPCSELREERFTEGGRVTSDKRLVVRDGVVYWLNSMPPGRFLEALSNKLRLDLGPADIERILKNKEANEVRKLRREIRQKKTLESKLLLAIGADEIRGRLPKPLVAALNSPTPTEFAKSALGVYGINVLAEFKEELTAKGLEPPKAWGGSRAAIEFVEKLGFPRDYAGFEKSKRPRVLEVEGPPRLGELHDYQQVIVQQIDHLLTAGPKKRRGLLSLPTGAGKTRVTVEALVRALEEGTLESPILWIAQTDELNEQAVQAWSEVWRANGPVGSQLTVSRLWASNDAEEVERGHQVVVATIAKLNAGVIESSDYAWLKKSSCVIIDEAHAAITPQYTSLLEWQGLKKSLDRAPLIGLTATPFRGTSETETKRLVQRFGGVRLDEPAFGGEDAYGPLQEKGVIARVEHELLEGIDIELSDAELADLKDRRLIPTGALKKVGADVGRTRTILNSIKKHDKGWTILVFAASVEHAEVLSALLTADGIPAAAISADTGPALRRHYVEAFRRGELRVLTNYGVFTEGFDAPAVRAVYVTRPTFSPNQYQQMIGRGLRGPLNRGKEVCTIVNVEDNVLNYGEELAFREFEYLWDGDPSS